MPGLLISGPAGAGKSRAARDMQQRAAQPAVVVDFQAVYAALLLLDRDEEKAATRKGKAETPTCCR